MSLKTLFALACTSLSACGDWIWCCWRSSSANDQSDAQFDVEKIDLTHDANLRLQQIGLPGKCDLIAIAADDRWNELQVANDAYTKFIMTQKASGKAKFYPEEDNISCFRQKGLPANLNKNILAWQDPTGTWHGALFSKDRYLRSLRNLSEEWKCDIKDVDNLKSKLGDKAKDKSDGSWYADLEGCFIFVDATKKCFCYGFSGYVDVKTIEGITFNSYPQGTRKKTVSWTEILDPEFDVGKAESINNAMQYSRELKYLFTGKLADLQTDLEAFMDKGPLSQKSDKFKCIGVTPGNIEENGVILLGDCSLAQKRYGYWRWIRGFDLHDVDSEEESFTQTWANYLQRHELKMKDRRVEYKLSDSVLQELEQKKLIYQNANLFAF